MDSTVSAYKTRSIRGLSLLETTVALYILSGALLVVVALFHSGIKARTETGKRQRASLALRAAHSRILAYSLQDLGNKYGYDAIRDTWGTTRTETSSLDPEFQVTYRISEESVLSPCTGFEERFPEAQRLDVGRRLAVQIEVTGLEQQVRSLCRIHDPPREVHPDTPIRIETVSNQDPLSRYEPTISTEENVYRGRLFDKHDQEILGATFTWGVIPVDGNATVIWEQDLSNRAGREARLRNYIVTTFGDIGYLPGEVELECLSQYRGVEYLASETQIRVAP